MDDAMVGSGMTDAPPKWVPHSLEGPAALGCVDRWLDFDDFVGDWPRGEQRMVLAFPSEWPAVFKQSVALRTLVNKRLRGTRCRAVEPALESDKAATKALTLRPLHSFQNALAVSEVLGWRLVKGFVVLESTVVAGGKSAALRAAIAAEMDVAEPAADASSFVAIRHWWNAREDGAWIDLTPPLLPPLPGRDARVLLVESERGEKHEVPLTRRKQDETVAAADRLVRAGATALAHHIMNGGELPAALGGAGDKEEGGAAATGGAVAKRDAAQWSSYESNRRWELLDLDDDDDAQAQPQQTFSERLEADVAAAVEKAKAEEAAKDPVKERAKELDGTVGKLKSAGLGLTTITKDGIAQFGSAAEEEQKLVDEHEAQVARARERLAADVYSDKWERATDEALVADAAEDAPPTKYQDMLRQMMGGENTITGGKAMWRKPDGYEEPDWDALAEQELAEQERARKGDGADDDGPRIEDVTDEVAAAPEPPPPPPGPPLEPRPPTIAPVPSWPSALALALALASSSIVATDE
jgi:hypothetical protein